MRLKFQIFTLLFLLMNQYIFSQENLQFNDLSKEESKVIAEKGTERPFTGKYEEFNEQETYLSILSTFEENLLKKLFIR